MQHQPADGGHPVSESAASDSVLSDMAAFAAQACPSDPAVCQAANAIALQVSFSTMLLVASCLEMTLLILSPFLL